MTTSRGAMRWAGREAQEGGYTCVCACSVTLSCLTVYDPMDCNPPRLLCPWDSPGENPGVGCHAFPQGIFPTQGSSPRLLRLLHCRRIIYPLFTHIREAPDIRIHIAHSQQGLTQNCIANILQLKKKKDPSIHVCWRKMLL